jgi:hypothetical protein
MLSIHLRLGLASGNLLLFNQHKRAVSSRLDRISQYAVRSTHYRQTEHKVPIL